MFSKTLAVAVAGATLLLTLSGCSNPAEVKEAKVLGGVLKRLAPEARDLVEQEHELANELKITLDESSNIDAAEFSRRFGGFVDRLIVMRDKRRHIADSVREGYFGRPMVFAVQNSAAMQMQDEIARTDSWIEIAQNVYLRAKLQHKGSFPEMAKLNKMIDVFLGLPRETPLYSQMGALGEEYRFGENDVIVK